MALQSVSQSRVFGWQHLIFLGLEWPKELHQQRLTGGCSGLPGVNPPTLWYEEKGDAGAQGDRQAAGLRAMGLLQDLPLIIGSFDAIGQWSKVHAS